MARRDLRDRQTRHDPAYRRAKSEQFASRAVYKLQELDKRFRLLGPGKRVLDLGCWPGSWMQHAAERVGDGGLVVGVDLHEVELSLPSWVETFVADVHGLAAEDLLARYGAFDTVLSDMGPNTTGDRRTDVIRSEALFEAALELGLRVLRPGGHFAAKVFQGGGFPGLLQRVRAGFANGRAVHAEATRTGSREQYLVGQGRRHERR